MLCDEVRSAAYQCWALLIKSGKKACEVRGQPSGMVAQLLQTVLPKVCNSMKDDVDPDTVRESADGLAECLKNAGAGCIQQAEFEQLVLLIFKLIDDSCQRTSKLQQEKQKESVGAPPELQGDEDDENNTEDDEENCRRSLEEVLGSLMQASPDLFTQMLPGPIDQKMTSWISQRQNATLALFLACDLLEHLKDQSQVLWPKMVPAIFASLHDKDPDLRIPSAYAVNLASKIPAFQQYATDAATKLAQIVSAPQPKKRREEKAKIAFDNAVAALLALALHQSAQCGAEAFSLVISKLPLKDDEEEAKKVHTIIVDAMLANHAGVIGANNANLGGLMKVLAEIYKQESICDKETDTKIVQIFKGLQSSQLTALAAGFSEKQQKKIERIVMSS